MFDQSDRWKTTAATHNQQGFAGNIVQNHANGYSASHRAPAQLAG